MRGLTERQREIIDFIEEHVAKKRYTPTYREIKEHFGFSSIGTVSQHLALLKKKNYLSDDRSPALAAPGPSSTETTDEVGLIGALRAGFSPSLFDTPETLSIPKGMVTDPSSTYAFRIEGDGFVHEHLMAGDILLVAVGQEAEDGQTVIALIDEGETVIRHLSFDDSYARLESRTLTQNPIILHRDDLVVQAIALGLIRRY